MQRLSLRPHINAILALSTKEERAAHLATVPEEIRDQVETEVRYYFNRSACYRRHIEGVQSEKQKQVDSITRRTGRRLSADEAREMVRECKRRIEV